MRVKRIKNNKPATRKQKEFARIIATEPTKTLTQAYKEVYDTDNMQHKTISEEASRTAKKPQVISELAKYSNLVENTLINTINEYQNSDDIKQRSLAINSSMYVHDKIHGKATQRIEQHSTTVKLSLSLKDIVEDQETVTDKNN